MTGPSNKDSNNDPIIQSAWDNFREAIEKGYSKDDAARDTNSSSSEVDQAWSDAAKDGAN